MSDLGEHLRSFIGFALDNSFLYLALNNLGVMLLLWLVSAVWICYAAHTLAPQRRIRGLALFCYLFFFLKEFCRINRSIADFSRGSSIPYRDVLFSLVLPHGLIEYLAFALAALFALLWLGSSLERGRWHYPGHHALLIPASLILLAAAVESTLTPYFYRIYLLKG